MRCVFHVALVGSATASLAFAGCLAPRLAPWLIGAWFSALTIVYGGHAVGVRYWGAPMSRDVILFGLRRFPNLAREHFRSTIAGCGALGVVFAAGWMAARFDLPASAAARMECYFEAAALLLLCAAGAWWVAHLSIRTDLVFGLLLNGHGPMPGPPPDDPALGVRGITRVASSSRRANVILFVVDSLRAHNMSALGYPRPTTPFLDALLAERGAQAVPMALSSSPSTEAALWALFSSRRARHQAVNAPCLHDVLRAAGYTVRFLLSGSHRHWMGLDALYGNDHDGFVDMLIDDQVVAEAEKLPDVHSAHGSFLFFHLMSTHGASGCEPARRWTPARNRFSYTEGAALDDADRERMVNHYDNSVLQADDCIARIWATLKAKGFLDDAIVMVTGDHGEAIAERIPVLIGHGRGMYQESIQVPLIVWDSAPTLPEPAFLADQTDVAPSFLARLGMEPPSAWQGASIWERPGRRHAHVEHIAHRAGMAPIQMEAVLVKLPSGLFKAIRYQQAGREILRQTFCLSTDAEEKHDLSGSLTTEIEAELENAWHQYHAQPALAFSTSWKYLNRMAEGLPAARSAHANAPETPKRSRIITAMRDAVGLAREV